MLEVMTEDGDKTQWQTLNEVFEQRARSAGGDVADYILLKESNDKIRRAAVDWLFDSLLAIAAEANREKSFSIEIERADAHRFAFGNSSLLGSRLALRQTIRCLTVEAGWTRAPADGFMRGGALAAARVSHFGISKANEALLLIRAPDNLINWFAVDRAEKRNLFDARNLQRHFQIFLDEN